MLKVVDFDLNFEGKEIIDNLSEVVGMKTTTFEYFDGRTPNVIETPIIEKTYEIEIGIIPMSFTIGRYTFRLEGIYVERYILKNGLQIESFIQKTLFDEGHIFIFKALMANEIIKKTIWSEKAIKATLEDFNNNHS